MTVHPIFIIDDNADFRHYAAVVIEAELHAATRQYPDGFEGLQACLANPPSAVLLDLEMPRLRGEEVLRLLRSSPSTRSVPVIVCSSMPEPQRREMEVLQLGADRYCPKPVDGTTLVRALKEVMSVSAAELDADHTRLEAPPRVRPSAPQEFEQFEILDVLGGGASGTVYKAREVGSDRIIALKVFLRSENTSAIALERFLRESRIMQTLDHPNIVRVYDTGNTDFTYYIAMEFVDGDTLASRCRDGSIPWMLAKSLILQLLDAVQYLHASGVIHRDIKPHNIFVSEDTLKLGDFGVSRSSSLEKEIDLTRPGMLVGTPRFMAPEQMLGEEANELTDQFAVGRTIVSMLEGPTSKIALRPLTDSRPDIPAAVSKVVARCLDPHPTCRYRSISALKKAFLAASDGD